MEVQPKGIIVAIGGNEDKGSGLDETMRLDFVTDGILSHVVKLGGGINAQIEVLPTASSIPKEVGENYLKAFDALNCKNVNVLSVRSLADANKSDVIERISKADVLMFSGGDQSKISAAFSGSKSLDVIRDRYVNDNIVIAGTSAGGMAMSQTMIRGGSASESMIKGAVKLGEGLGLSPGFIFDSHFIRRGRFGRLAEAVALHPDLIGVGLGEDTGVIIKNGSEFQVIGSGMVIIFDGQEFTHNSVKLLKKNTPISIGNMIVHVLANSDKFNLNDKTLKVLPLEAEFI